MNPQRKPLNLVNLHGEGCFGSVTLARPTAQELRFLPAGALGRALGALTGRRDAPPDGHNYGPCYYMPRLFLDSALATLGGLLFWGYAKKLARFTVGADRFAIQGENGAPQVSLGVKAMGEPQPVAARPQISAVQAMLAQPLVSQRRWPWGRSWWWLTSTSNGTGPGCGRGPPRCRCKPSSCRASAPAATRRKGHRRASLPAYWGPMN